MKRTTVTIPDELAHALEREARRKDTSASDVVREALTAYLGMTPGVERALPFIGIFESEDHTLSEQIGDFVAARLADHVEREHG